MHGMQTLQSTCIIRFMQWKAIWAKLTWPVSTFGDPCVTRCSTHTPQQVTGDQVIGTHHWCLSDGLEQVGAVERRAGLEKSHRYTRDFFTLLLQMLVFSHCWSMIILVYISHNWTSKRTFRIFFVRSRATLLLRSSDAPSGSERRVLSPSRLSRQWALTPATAGVSYLTHLPPHTHDAHAVACRFVVKKSRWTENQCIYRRKIQWRFPRW